MKQPAIIGAALLLGAGVALGATVFRSDIAQATGLAQSVTVNNTPAEAVPVRDQNLDSNQNIKVHEQGTARVQITNTSVPVQEQIETQLLFDQELQDGGRVTIPVAAYKTLHFDFDLTNGTCATSGASLLVVEATRFLERARIGADEACTGGFTGKTIEMPGRSVTLIVHALPGDTWRVVVFGRAN